jgi:hypothetical protein
MADQMNNSVPFAEYCNKGLGCAVATNSILIKSQAGSNAIIPSLDLSALTDTTLGSYTVILPPLAAGDHNVEIVKISNDANVLTIRCFGNDTFADGTTTFTLYNQNDYLDLLATSASNIWAVRGFRQRSASNNSGFSGLAGSAAAQMGSGGAAQTITSPTPVAFTIYLFDNGLPNPYYATASPTKFLAPGDGIYEVQASVPVSATLYNTIGSVGTVNLVLRMNGNTYGPPSATATFITSTATTTTITCVVAVSGLLHMTSASYVEATLLNLGLPSLQTITTGGGALGAVGQFSITQVG